ncbi:MAG: hypothetical protein K0S44_620 [Bacteroidetes bacterium]|jgi:hypothetical protein|nr:hypothetical protein [Bacteroidota bacterium]
MKSKIIFSIICLLVFTGCNKILLYSYGVRNPKVETSHSITKYLHSNELDTANNYAFRDTASLTKFYNKNIGIPEIRFYDKNGYLMLYRDEKKCNGQNDSLISFLNPHNVIRVDSTDNIFDYLEEVRKINGLSVNKEEFSGFDYYLVMYWAKYLGKVNSIKMRDWESTLMKKQDLKIKTIKLTTDYMDFWPLDKKNMIKIYSPKTKTTDRKKEREASL